MQILNIAGYKFISLHDLSSWKKKLHEQCSSLAIKGTLLLSQEGINISLAGIEKNIQAFKFFLRNEACFADLSFRESYSTTLPFQHLKIKIKPEIITLKQPHIHPEYHRAPSISPTELKSWLDEKREMTLLDTRNDYEIRFGTFSHALNLHLHHFTELPTAIQQVNREKPVVMFCTGGIRCEKAALFMLDNGFSNVLQLDGGILNYFAEVGGTHYKGECFVFDERIAIDTHLQETKTSQCKICQSPINQAKPSLPPFVSDLSCNACG